MPDPLSVEVDPLSQILNMLDAQCRLTGTFVAGDDWSRRFSNRGATKFCFATQGSAWFQVNGEAPSQFCAGDVLVTNGTKVLTMASTVPALSRIANTPLAVDEKGSYRVGNGVDFTMMSGLVSVESERQALLRSALPAVMRIPAGTPDSAPLAWLLSQLLDEMNSVRRPGSSSVIIGLTQLIFAHALRAYVAASPTTDQSWLRGLSDPRLAAALFSIHSHPQRNWNVGALATRARMSRTAFALRFRDIMGITPLAYLTRWRMHLAQRALRTGLSVADAAAAVGYASESAFGSAYKRVMGVAPGRVRQIRPSRGDDTT